MVASSFFKENGELQFNLWTCLDVHAKRRGLLPSSQGKASKDDTVAAQKTDKGGHHVTGDKDGRGGTETPSPSGKRLVNLKVSTY